MESIVTSLEWSKKLKEIGFNKPSFFWWWRYNKTKEYYIAGNDFGSDGFDVICPAYTTDELLRELPELDITINCNKEKEHRVHNQYGLGDSKYEKIIYGKKLPDMLAEFYCYLSENNLLSGGVK